MWLTENSFKLTKSQKTPLRMSQARKSNNKMQKMTKNKVIKNKKRI